MRASAAVAGGSDRTDDEGPGAKRRQHVALFERLRGTRELEDAIPGLIETILENSEGRR